MISQFLGQVNISRSEKFCNQFSKSLYIMLLKIKFSAINNILFVIGVSII